MIEVLRRAGVCTQLKAKLPADDERVVAANQELLIERLLVHIHGVLAGDPSLTDESAADRLGPGRLVSPVSTLTPAQRSERARIAANARWTKEPDRLAATAPGRRAMHEAFERQVDPRSCSTTSMP
jgi:hypothetical protein